jgi:hypothetical protein
MYESDQTEGLAAAREGIQLEDRRDLATTPAETFAGACQQFMQVAGGIGICKKLTGVLVVRRSRATYDLDEIRSKVTVRDAFQDVGTWFT